MNENHIFENALKLLKVILLYIQDICYYHTYDLIAFRQMLALEESENLQINEKVRLAVII